MGQPYIGEIRIFAGNFPPVGWAFCNGQELSVAENSELFALIGTTYGGNGQDTFALPDLQGRVPLHMGTNGGDTYLLGEKGGLENYTLSTRQIPSHQHVLAGNVFMPAYGENPANNNQPASKYAAITPAIQQYTPNKDASAKSAPLDVKGDLQGAGTMMEVTPAGGSQPFDIMQPFQVLNFIISLYGVYPSQN